MEKRNIFLLVFILSLVFFVNEVNALVYLNDCATLQSNQVYVLTQDIVKSSRTGHCFEIPDGTFSNIVLDLGGHTITFDTWPVVGVANPSFETGKPGDATEALNWDFSNAPDARRENNQLFYRAGGNYSVVFPANSNPQYIQSDPIFLPGGVTYSVFILFKPADQDAPHEIYVEIPQIPTACSSPIIQTAGTSTSWASYACTFNNPSDINVNIRIGNNMILPEDYSVDMAEIKPVFLDGSEIIRSTGSGAKTNITIRNGTIIQGPAQSFGNDIDGKSMVRIAGSPISNSKVYDLTINSTGIEVLPLSVDYAQRVEIYNNNLSAHVTHTRRRSALLSALNLYDGDQPAIYGRDSLIYNNKIWSYQVAIKLSGQNNSVFNNTIYHDAIIPNAYAINMRSGYTNNRVYNNTITGNGRGIYINTGSGAQVYNNFIDMMELPNIEYIYWWNSGSICAHGIKFENQPTNFYVHDNYVRMTQIPGSWAGCPLAMSRSMTSGQIVNGLIENNEFVQVTSYNNANLLRAPVAGHFVEVVYPVNLTIRGNRFVSNSRGMIWVDKVFGLNFDSNTFIDNNPLGLENYFLHNEMGGGEIRLVDTTFLNTSTTLDLSKIYALGPQPWNYFIDWYLKIRALNAAYAPLPGANVVVRDRNNQVVFSQTTGANGEFLLNLTQYEMTSSGQTNSSPYNVSVTYSGETKYTSPTINLDHSQELTFVFGGNSPDVNSDGNINILDLAIEVFWQGRSQAGNPSIWQNYDHLDLNEDSYIDFDDVRIVMVNM